MFQSYALFPNLSVADNVAYGLVNRRMPRAQVARARRRAARSWSACPAASDKFPAQLSGGQQQRIALARALATSPGLLLLDEPLSALDAIVRVHLRQEIRSLQRKLGVTTIMVTHDQEEALSMADRIVVMNHGVIEQVGTPMQVYRDPAHALRRRFRRQASTCCRRRLAEAPAACASATRRFDCARTTARRAARCKVYLRPEDVLARPIAPGDSNVFEAQIDKIEFLGSYCLVRVRADALGEHRLTVYLSLNFLAEQQLEVGGAAAAAPAARAHARLF